MTKKELQEQHDQEVKLAIASELSRLSEEDLRADDSQDRILLCLMAAAVAAESVNDRLGSEHADDAAEEDYWSIHFDPPSAIASVLWWFINARDLDIEDVSVSCVGSSPLMAFALFAVLRRFKMSYETEIELLIDGIEDKQKALIAERMKTLPTTGLGL